MTREMNRRSFLLATGRWLALAAFVPTLSGCARALRWSESQGGAAVEPGAAPSPPATPAPPVIPTSTTTGPTSTTAVTPSTQAPNSAAGENGFPDLAVFRGEHPDVNVRAAVAALGGPERFVRPGDKVVVKPNVLTGRPPEYAVTTNPLVVAAVVKMCLEAGAGEVTVLDYPVSSPRTAFQTSGIAQAVADAGGRLKYLSSRDFARVDIPAGRAITSWPLVTEAVEADTLINIPIGKHHGLAGLTLAMKNLMGIMGDPRGSIHQGFPQKITDINTVVKPHLVILDAFRILVRNGPTGGRLEDVEMPKTVVAGTSQVAVDAYGATLMGRNPADLPWLVEAHSRGLGEIDLNRLNILEGAA